MRLFVYSPTSKVDVTHHQSWELLMVIWPIWSDVDIITFVCLCGCFSGPDLQQRDQHHQGSDGIHHPSVVGQHGFAAAAPPHVELLRVVVVAVVGAVVGHLALDAGSGGAGVTAAERDSVHQILAVHVAPNAAKRMRQSVKLESCYDRMKGKVSEITGHKLAILHLSCVWSQTATWVTTRCDDCWCRLFLSFQLLFSYWIKLIIKIWVSELVVSYWRHTFKQQHYKVLIRNETSAWIEHLRVLLKWFILF